MSTDSRLFCPVSLCLSGRSGLGFGRSCLFSVAVVGPSYLPALSQLSPGPAVRPGSCPRLRLSSFINLFFYFYSIYSVYFFFFYLIYYSIILSAHYSPLLSSFLFLFPLPILFSILISFLFLLLLFPLSCLLSFALSLSSLVPSSRVLLLPPRALSFSSPFPSTHLLTNPISAPRCVSHGLTLTFVFCVFNITSRVDYFLAFDLLRVRYDIGQAPRPNRLQQLNLIASSAASASELATRRHSNERRPQPFDFVDPSTPYSSHSPVCACSTAILVFAICYYDTQLACFDTPRYLACL